MAAVEGVEGLVVEEVALGEAASIEVDMTEVAILLEVGTVEVTGEGPGGMRHIKGCNCVVWPCTGTARSKQTSRGSSRVYLGARLSFTGPSLL